MRGSSHTFLYVIGLLLAASTASLSTLYLWRTHPYATGLAAVLLLLGGGVAVRYPRNSLAYSLLFGGVLGIFVGSAVALVLHNLDGEVPFIRQAAEVELVLVLVSVLGCAAIALYATWLLAHRLRRGDSPRKSFGQWLKHLFEAVWGL